MLQKKICLLGAFSVGKTSLIKRYVNSIFDEKYHTTVGVKIDKKKLTVSETDITLMIWDIAGKDDVTEIRPSQLRGLSGFVVVIDGTRRASFKTAMSIFQQVNEVVGELPAIFVINKTDLKESWVLTDKEYEFIQKLGYPVIETSAKTGDAVNSVFVQLAERMVLEQKESAA